MKYYIIQTNEINTLCSKDGCDGYSELTWRTCHHKKITTTKRVSWCTHGNVISTYDTPAKAKTQLKRILDRHTKKHQAEMDAKIYYFETDDLSEFTNDKDAEAVNAEAKMLAWAAKADNLLKT